MEVVDDHRANLLISGHQPPAPSLGYSSRAGVLRAAWSLETGLAPLSPHFRTAR